MIVDDEPINIMTVRQYFQDAGFPNVAATSEPRQIMATMERDNPDLLLLDIMLPGIDGLEVLKTIRSSARFARVPVIILTAVDDRKVKAAALELGATDFLTKPVDSLDLVPRVRNVLAVKAHQDYLSGMPTSWNGKCSCGPPSWRPRVWRSFIAWAGRPNIATTIPACTCCAWAAMRASSPGNWGSIRPPSS